MITKAHADGQIPTGALKVTEIEKVYRCPKCDGTEVKWDYGIRKIVCPKDRTPLDGSWEP